MSEIANHVVLRNQGLFCTNCGIKHIIPMPIDIKSMVEMMDSFSKLHEKCPKTWVENQVDPNLEVRKRMEKWLENGERGISSETMFATFSGDTSVIGRSGTGHPLDMDDFSRCYKLLKLIPEWKLRIHEMEKVSPQWKYLVSVWDKLTEIYERRLSAVEDFAKLIKYNGPKLK